MPQPVAPLSCGLGSSQQALEHPAPTWSLACPHPFGQEPCHMPDAANAPPSWLRPTAQPTLIRRARIWDGEDWKLIQPGQTWRDGEVGAGSACGAVARSAHGIHASACQ